MLVAEARRKTEEKMRFLNGMVMHAAFFEECKNVSYFDYDEGGNVTRTWGTADYPVSYTY
jgi:hypothetical protein